MGKWPENPQTLGAQGVSAWPLLKIKVGRKWANGQFSVIFGLVFMQDFEDFWPVSNQKWANGQFSD